MSEIISFTSMGNSDLVFLLGDLLCTICYEGDYEIENARKNIREILKNGIEGEFERRK